MLLLFIFFKNITGSGTHEVTYTNKEIFEILKEHFKSDLETQIKMLEEIFSAREKINLQMDKNTKSVIKRLRAILGQSGKSRATQEITSESLSPTTSGRPYLALENFSERSKRRKTEDIR